MDDAIINVLTQALGGDAQLARMVNGLHRLAVTVATQGDELTTIKSAMERMVPATPELPPHHDLEATP